MIFLKSLYLPITPSGRAAVSVVESTAAPTASAPGAPLRELQSDPLAGQLLPIQIVHCVVRIARVVEFLDTILFLLIIFKKKKKILKCKIV